MVGAEHSKCDIGL